MGIPYRAGDATPRARKPFGGPAENRLENQRHQRGRGAFGSEGQHTDLQDRKDGSEAACLKERGRSTGRISRQNAKTQIEGTQEAFILSSSCPSVRAYNCALRVLPFKSLVQWPASIQA